MEVSDAHTDNKTMGQPRGPHEVGGRSMSEEPVDSTQNCEECQCQECKCKACTNTDCPAPCKAEYPCDYLITTCPDREGE